MNPANPNFSALPEHSTRRGSLLIVAMILCAVIGISLVSYIQLSRTALNLSTRSVYNNAAINIAEQGVEEAVYAINKMVADPTYDWSGAGWQPQSSSTISGTHKRRRWKNISLSQNSRGECRVVLFKLDQANPYVISRALINFGTRDTPPIEKWIRVDLAKTSKFSNGMVARSNIRFTGSTAYVNSWNSLAADGSTVPYSDAVDRDNGSVGSISISADAVTTWNADISGFVSTGGVDPTTLVGPTGSIMGDTSVYDAETWTKTTVDPNRISTNFSATFDTVTAPTNLPIADLDLTTGIDLPRASDLNADLNYVYYYTASKIQLSGSGEVIRIGRKVVISVSGNVATSGNGGIEIGSTGSLALYTPGDVSLGGNGVMNGTDGADSGSEVTGSELGRPIQFQLWGTAGTSGQSISLSGTSDFSGVVYAPNASVNIGGTSQVCGSVVANTITMGGSAAFHYDESLGNFGGNNPFRVSKWRELTRAEDRDVTLRGSTWETL